VNLRLVATLLLTTSFACDSSPPPPVPAKGEAKAPATKADEPDAKATIDPAAGLAKAPDPAGEPSRQWLVWYADGEGWITRWVAERGEATETLAQRKVLVHGTGDALIQIVRRDEIVTVRTCACMGSDFGPKDECELTGEVTRPGLAAIDLKSGKEQPLVAADGESIFGEVYGISLAVVGGVDGRLVVRTQDAGYYCGAHQMIDGGDRMFDLSAPDLSVAAAHEWPKLEFPAALKTAAATGEMFDLYKECEGEEGSIDDFVRDTMRWSGLHIALEAGVPKLTWEFAADVYYACSPDYLALGTTTTGLLPEAASLGLGESLPAGLQRALTEVGTASAVGWVELKLSAEAEAELLAKFGTLEETPWPPASSEVRPKTKAVETGATTETVDTATARAKLAEARTLTRAKDYVGGIAAFDAAIAADPKMARAWAGRGYAKLLAGELDAAKKDCTHALTLDDTPGFQASVHYNLGLIAQQQGKTAVAKKAFRTSLDLRPNDEVLKAHDAL
jgi:tetratricopeptide (TPR) repeat protein